MKSKRFIPLSAMLALTTGLFTGMISAHKNNNVEAVYAASSWTAYTHYDGAIYYNGIADSLTGSSLTTALRSLNNTKKKTNGGYNALLKGDFWARYTDFDSSSSVMQDTTHNLPYSNTIVSFYSGNTAYNGNGMNREHVWPNSKGGSLVEADSHMARPTLTSENSARGNSFYVEGMKSTSQGWDPAMETWGDETYRGDAARIIFYCAIANGSLTLVDKNTDANANNTMGKLSDILKWNLMYPVKQREMNRNEAVEAIQGNRNPFIDHPEYACRIWGETNNTTREICGKVIPALTLSSSSLTISNGGTAEISGTSSTGTSISWATSDANVVSISSASSASGSSITLTGVSLGTAKISATTVIEGQTLLRECTVTVSDAPSVKSVSLNATNISLNIDQGYELKLIPDPADATLPEFIWTSSNEQVATVSSKGLVMARGLGTAVITAKSSSPAFTLTCTVNVVSPSSGGGCGGNIVTTSIILSTLSLLGVGILLIKRKFIK